TMSFIMKHIRASSFQEFKELLEKKKNQFQFIFDHIHVFREFIELRYGKAKDGLIDRANHYLNHEFRLFGSQWTKLCDESSNGQHKIKWNCDFLHGHSWPYHVVYSKVTRRSIGNSDVKVPWELSRSHHLVTLGQAFVLTGDKKYAEEFQLQVEDWIDQNPVGFGINWACTMDVGIRVANWLFAMDLFREHAFSDQFLVRFYGSVYDHGQFIEKHLEHFGSLTINHLLGDLIGLFFVSMKCEHFKKASYWKNLALKSLTREFKKQVHGDGVDFEGSTSYHKLVIEFLFYVIFYCQRSSISLPASYGIIAEKMLDFELAAINNDGTVPQVGDNDSGRLFMFNERPSLDHMYLLDIAGIFFKAPKFKQKPGITDFECAWLFDGKEITEWDMTAKNSSKDPVSWFKDAGWVILKSRNNSCFISCGKNGQNGVGGHNHNDKLSFDLQLDGVSIFVDPGTYVYTSNPRLRNRFRSTRFHNTVFIAGMEQNQLGSDLFKMAQASFPKIIAASETDDSGFFRGRLLYPSKLMHVRDVILNKHDTMVTIKDTITGKSLQSSCLVEWNFTLAPGVTFDEKKQEIVAKNKRYKIETEPREIFTKSRGFFSAGYQEIEKVEKIRRVSEIKLPFSSTIVIKNAI
nr:alginate lyase family protein [Candidatus Sigynarchaeota archaeon]